MDTQSAQSLPTGRLFKRWLINTFKKPTAAIRSIKAKHSRSRSAPSAIYLETSAQSPSYHADEKAHYALPNDTPEHSRLDTQAAHLSNLVNCHVFHSPISDRPGQRMLDCGCGTGAVTHLMSEEFPNAECIGVDLSQVPPSSSQKPNARFFQGNVLNESPVEWKPSDGEAGLTQDRHIFDYAFSRLLVLGMSEWPAFIRKEFDMLKPGGWAEIHDIDFQYYDQHGRVISADWTWLSALRKVCEEEKAMDFSCGSQAEKWMKDAQFHDVQAFKYVWPFGGESEATPEKRAFSEYLVSAQPGMFHHLIERAMKGRESDKVIEEMRRDMRGDMARISGKPGNHMLFYVTIGRKPESARL